MEDEVRFGEIAFRCVGWVWEIEAIGVGVGDVCDVDSVAFPVCVFGLE